MKNTTQAPTNIPDTNTSINAGSYIQQKCSKDQLLSSRLAPNSRKAQIAASHRTQEGSEQAKETKTDILTQELV